MVLTACLISWNVPAQETAEDAAFLDFIKADPKLPEAPNIPPPTPTEAAAMLGRWKKYEAAQMAKLQQSLSEARKIAIEMLSKKAISATGLVRDGLLREVEYLRNLAPDAPLSTIPEQGELRQNALLGFWTNKERENDPNWVLEFRADGKHKYSDGKLVPWHWIDADAGVLGSGQNWADLYWMEKPGFLLSINAKHFRYTIFRKPTPPAKPKDPIIIKLNASEIAQRRSTMEALTAQRNKVVKWLFDKAKKMPPAEISILIQDVRQIEVEADKQGGYAALLAGLWKWDNSEITFQPYGVLLSKDGRPAGRWGWIDEKRTHFAVVLNGGKKAKDVFLAQSPVNATQPTVEAHRLANGHLIATRTLP